MMGRAWIAVAAAAAAPSDEALDRSLREEQLREARRLAEAYPKDDNALYLVGLVLGEQGNRAEAGTSSRRSPAASPSSTTTGTATGPSSMRTSNRASPAGRGRGWG